ncbi:hypothetical protein C5470_18115 [Photorhabdus stackebrandtii]|uniref:Uncharacterized protein n=1 Tax=Photorhabdus stackebrandtii TaxID=1123042 RepID=A0A7X5QPM4_9GAMM|nr:hypothetical protein [Photorhabdus stackebrandtii]
MRGAKPREANGLTSWYLFSVFRLAVYAADFLWWGAAAKHRVVTGVLIQICDDAFTLDPGRKYPPKREQKLGGVIIRLK